MTSSTKTINPAEPITLTEKTAKLNSADSKIIGEALVKHTIGASTKAAKEFTPNAMITGSTDLKLPTDAAVAPPAAPFALPN